MPIAPPALVTGAVRQPLPFGLFSTFTFRPSTGDDRWRNGVEFETLTCEPVDGLPAYDCDTSSPGKNFDGNAGEVGESSEFTVYGHHTCAPVGTSEEQAQSKAIEHLVSREEARVEQAFWTGDLDNTPNLTGSEVLESSGVGGAVGIGLLEQFIAVNYGSLGVIHLTRALATSLLAQRVLEVRNGRLVTVLGTPVVAGSGYTGSGPTGQAAPTSPSSWAYVTPALFGYRSEVFPRSEVDGTLFDRSINLMHGLAERTYLLGFDPCGTAAVLIDPTIV